MAAVVGLSASLNVAAQKRRSAYIRWLAYASVLGLTVCFAVLTVVTAPSPFSLAALLLLALVAAVLVRPELGLWFVAFFAVAGDAVTMRWYPFVRSMSVGDSILYVSRSAKISPVEVLLAMTAVGWILRMAATRRWEFRRGALFRPIMAFGLFVVLGLVIGLSRRGDTSIAFEEVRPLFSLVVIYVLATNLAVAPGTFRRLWSALVGAVVVDSLFAIAYYQGLSTVVREQADHLGEHPAALHANAFFVLLAAMGVMSARSTRRLVLMLLAAPVVGYAYILGERRAAFIGLMIGTVMLAVVLYRRRRRAFWYVIPLVTIVFAGYLVAFWNAAGSPGFPAEAVKTVVAPDQLSERDQSSDVYRAIENYNVVFTIRSQPLTGIGFGQQYLRPRPNADIAFAQGWQYKTHNAVLWIWMQTGVGGFLAMLYLLASAIRHGTRRLMHVTLGYEAALLLTSVVFVLMYAAFAYVDIAWDLQSMVFLGIAFACIANDSPADTPAAIPKPSPGDDAHVSHLDATRDGDEGGICPDGYTTTQVGRGYGSGCRCDIE